MFFKNFSIYFLGLITSGLVSFLVIPLIIRFFGVEVYGDFSLIQNVILILVSFSSGWLNQCILRFNDFSQNFKVAIFQLYLIVLFPSLLLCLGLLFYLKSDVLVVTIGIASLFFGGFSALMTTFYQSKFKASKTLYVDIVRVFSFVIPLLVIGYFGYFGKSYAVILYCFCVSYFLAFLVLMIPNWRFFIISVRTLFSNLSQNKIFGVVSENKKYITYGWPLALWFTISSILNVSDRYIIDLYYTKNDVGVYSSIYDLIYKGVTLLFIPILSSGYPIMTKKYNDGLKQEAFAFLKKMIVFEIAIFLVMLLVGFLLRDFFIEKIVGIPKTKLSVGIVIPVMIGAFVWQLAMLIHKPLEFELKTRVMLFFIGIALAANIFLNIVFIPIYGVIFAAYSTIISSMIYLLSVGTHFYFLNSK